MRTRRLLFPGLLLLATTVVVAPLAAAGGRASITAADLKAWLTVVSSDAFGGRSVFTEGLGMTASFLEDRLREWHVAPAGDHGTYLQAVEVRSVRTTSRSSITVQVGRESKTFADGEGVTFPRNMGAPQTFTIDRVEFAAYGLDAPGNHYSDLAGKDFAGAGVVFIGSKGPKALDVTRYRRLLGGRGRWLTEQLGAAAAFGQAPPPRPATTGAPASEPTRRPDAPDFITTQRLDAPIAPSVTLNDEALTWLFSAAPRSYASLQQAADAQEDLPSFRLDGVRITVHIDADYGVVRTQRTQNVVATVAGTDPTLKQTYVAIGAHYDHVGMAEQELAADGTRPGAPGLVTPGHEQDRIWNGADDDGSGTVALLALARAFAQGPRPKRSLLFVWHAGEERGLYGSRYFADYPTVPLAQIVAQLNIDMIGRNRDDKASEADTVYPVGSDRISSELHAINLAANRALPQPLRLDFEMNDPADPEQVYFRSDHYSYAAKGIPIIFYTTGLHPDYHANTDEVSKIEFPKMARVTQLVYETATRVGNLDHAPVRDRKGPRAGKGAPQ